MPELPEVETIRRQVSPLIVDHTIASSWARLDRITRPDVATFIRLTRGATILDSGRVGKQLYFPLSNGAYLLIHLGMSGRLAVEPAKGRLGTAALPRHVHGVLRFTDYTQLVYTDPRTFGLLEVAPDLSGLQTLGPEPLDPALDAEALAEELGRHSSMIKAVLLDQRRVAGLGNIYADEVCYEAGIHPAARACDLAPGQLRALVSCMRPILERAIIARGATLKDGGYQDLFGQFGEFIPKTYGNTGSPCTVCGTPIAQGKLGTGKGARSYHFCPACQGAGPLRLQKTALAASGSIPKGDASAGPDPTPGNRSSPDRDALGRVAEAPGGNPAGFAARLRATHNAG